MADKDGLKVAKDYHTDVPFGNQGSFHVKGANNTDWGMKRHLSNIFDPVSGNTVMFAFDHGYFMGSTAGLERLDLVVVAVGKDMERTDRFFKLATRIVAEMGVQLVKTYYCDNFEEVVAACPVPIVVAGGKKLPEDEALTLAYRSIQGGARGLDMGRNIFQSNHPVEMAKAIRMIVHQKATDKEAYEFYTDAIHTK